MSDLTNVELLEFIDETLAWASYVSEMWTGTLHEKIIDVQMAKLIKTVDANDLEDAYNLAHSLAQTIQQSADEYEGATR